MAKTKKAVKLADPQAVVGDITPTFPPSKGAVKAPIKSGKKPTKSVPRSGAKTVKKKVIK
jgi:hypothetical protein